MNQIRMMKYALFVCCWVAVLLILPAVTRGQSSDVAAEAIQQANLRSAPSVDAMLVGQIASGTRYPIIGRSQFYPWYVLGDPATQQPIGWVYADLVTVYGNVNTVTYSDQMVINPSAPPTASSAPTLETAPTGTLPVSGIALPSATPNAQVSSTGITGVVTGEINVRYGPGVEYPRIGVANAGEEFEITARHTQFPWVQIRYPGAPNGFGWVANDLLDIKGDIFSVPAMSQTSFDLPTLTATPPVVMASSLSSGTPVPITGPFQALGNELWNMMLAAGFDPATSRLAGLFLMDLRTGEAVTFGNNMAFSGMSLNKIAILSALYSTLSGPPDIETAVHIANMMVCSENSASNALLAKLGDGDAYKGGQVVSEFMRKIGLGNTFIVAPFLTDPNATPEPVTAPTTNVDQIRAEPDYSNQMTVDNLGWLLDGVYQCAYNNSGLLMSAAPDQFDQRECRQMLDVMSDNNLGEPLLMSAGVPANTRVAHKHGWTPDTHGNAGIVFSPGGDYDLVVSLHNPTWLDFSESFPLITEISHTIYNYYNPTAPIETDREPFIVPVDDCKVAGSPIIDELTSGSFTN